MRNSKFTKILFLFILVFCCSIVPVNAAKCDGILTVGAAELLKEVIGWVKVLIPILLVVLGGIDFGTVVVSGDKDSLSKSALKFVKRCIAAVAIYFVPFIVTLLLNMPGIKGKINLVDDPLCEIE